MSDSTPVTVEGDGFTVTSTSETAEQITESLKPDPAPEPEPAEPAKPTDPKLSKAAAKLGQKGGETTAAKRAAEKEAAQEAETEGAEGEGTETEKLGKPRHDPKARMLEATRQAAEAKRDRDRLAARVAELEAGRKPEEQPKPKAAAAPGKPKAEDFESYEEFVEALADFKADQRLQQFQTQNQERERFQARDQRIRTAATTFYSRQEEAAKTDPTFKDRTRDLAATLQPSFMMAQDQQLGPLNVVADEIINSAQAPALMLHFSEHPEELQRLSTLPGPADVQVEVRLIAKSLSAAPLPPAKAEVSQAKAPTRPVVGSPYTADEPGEEASFDEHLRFHNTRERAARR